MKTLWILQGAMLFSVFAMLACKHFDYLRALQHYPDLSDVKRLVVNTHAMDPQALLQYFGGLSPEWALECLKELMTVNARQNLQLVVNIGKEYTEQIGADKIIALLEEFKSYEGLYFFLGSLINSSEDPHTRKRSSRMFCTSSTLSRHQSRSKRVLRNRSMARELCKSSRSRPVSGGGATAEPGAGDGLSTFARNSSAAASATRTAMSSRSARVLGSASAVCGLAATVRTSASLRSRTKIVPAGSTARSIGSEPLIITSPSVVIVPSP